ncbi:nitrate/nitrite transporter [Actinomyces slackii]|uniref:Probable nitrate transporter narT n=1 Tax=Actinomyces slackii TaxID=52774 RepID=A0A3S4SD97_9ACTO|nr:nitrate/nitrite transporter [Actinomyces slackii]VEG73399.1 Probable nitrate transporter narT [Actinomyces slackii]
MDAASTESTESTECTESTESKETAPSAPDPAAAHHEAPGAYRVLSLSTISFTLMFAVWLMFGLLGKPIQKEFGLDEVQLSWISAVAVLNGSMWRLPAGILADRFGGKIVMTVMMVLGAVSSLLVSMASSYAMLLVLAFCVGVVGNSFSAGVAWNSAWFTPRHKGFALGVFGAGNVGASVTKLIGPGIIAATAGSTYVLGIQGGWRLIPVVYAVLLAITVVLLWFTTPMEDRKPGKSASLSSMLKPLRDIRVWRFSLYYVIVFGAYVAYSAILPTYYQDHFHVSLGTAGLLTASFIFPASLLRPLGGWVSDRWGARVAMYGTFLIIGAVLTVLCLPSGVDDAGRPYGLPLWLVVLLVFLVGCAMGIGKAAVYKHIPTYFPDNVGSVGGLVGMLGGLGGFFLPPAFAYIQRLTGLASTPFIVLTLITGATLIWMHLVIQRMRRAQPEADHIEVPA